MVIGQNIHFKKVTQKFWNPFLLSDNKFEHIFSVGQKVRKKQNTLLNCHL